MKPDHVPERRGHVWQRLTLQSPFFSGHEGFIQWRLSSVFQSQWSNGPPLLWNSQYPQWQWYERFFETFSLGRAIEARRGNSKVSVSFLLLACLGPEVLQTLFTQKNFTRIKRGLEDCRGNWMGAFFSSVLMTMCENEWTLAASCEIEFVPFVGQIWCPRQNWTGVTNYGQVKGGKRKDEKFWVFCNELQQDCWV
jgi:hypothetical protein